MKSDVGREAASLTLRGASVTHEADGDLTSKVRPFTPQAPPRTE